MAYAFFNAALATMRRAFRPGRTASCIVLNVDPNRARDGFQAHDEWTGRGVQGFCLLRFENSLTHPLNEFVSRPSNNIYFARFVKAGFTNLVSQTGPSQAFLPVRCLLNPAGQQDSLATTICCCLGTIHLLC
jgi:hypothetical protein